MSLTQSKKLVYSLLLYALFATFYFGDAAHSHLFQWTNTDYCVSCILTLINHADNPGDTKNQVTIYTSNEYLPLETNFCFCQDFFFITDIPRAPPLD